MYEAMLDAKPKKKAHENMQDAIRALKFPGRMTDAEREQAMEELITHCRARVNDIIPDEILEVLCRDLLVVAVNSNAQMAPSVWQFVVSQLEDEGLAIMLLEEIADVLDEGWVVVQHPSGVHLPMTADNYDTELAPGLGILGMLMELGRMIPGLPLEIPDIGGQIIARVGPQPEVGEDEVVSEGCICDGCPAKGVICPGMDDEECGREREFAGAGIPDEEQAIEADPAEIADRLGSEPDHPDEVIQGIRDRCRQCADTPAEDVSDAPAEEATDTSTEENTDTSAEGPAATDTPAEDEAVEVPAASD